jgi:hypothetical protein
MSAQAAVAGLIVLLCAVYAVWALMPAAWRRAFASRLLALAPGWAWLQRAARAPGACGGCDNCGNSGGAAADNNSGAAKVIRIHPRKAP